MAKIDDNWHVMGLSGTGSDTFEIEDLFVAEEDTIDRENLDELQDLRQQLRSRVPKAFLRAVPDWQREPLVP